MDCTNCCATSAQNPAPASANATAASRPTITLTVSLSATALNLSARLRLARYCVAAPLIRNMTASALVMVVSSACPKAFPTRSAVASASVASSRPTVRLIQNRLSRCAIVNSLACTAADDRPKSRTTSAALTATSAMAISP